ncbi:MAG: FecCD family ABC transporter permease [Spirochaetota bacterium]
MIRRRGVEATLLLVLVGLLGLPAAMIASVSVGAADIDLAVVWRALLSAAPRGGAADTPAPELVEDYTIIRTVRLPRVLMAALVGAALATAGAIMQAMTRNPLAGPTIMGLNSGAAFAVVAVFAAAPALSYNGLVAVSFAGAALGAGLSFGITYLSPGGQRPAKLAVAGAAVTALLESLTRGLVVYLELGQDVLFYTAGGVQGVGWEQLRLAAPWILAGLAIALGTAANYTVLNLGDAVAIGVGQRVRLLRTVGTLTVLLLAGASVAVAGGVGFVGLAVPHITRFLVGPDYRRVLPGAVLIGATLVVLADLGARMVNPPYETPVGLITALVGVPLFLYLARSKA